MALDYVEEKLTVSERASRLSQGAPFVVGGVVLVGLYLSSLHHFLLFHTIAELFSIAVAFAILMLTWNSRRYFDNSTLQFIGIAYFFVGVLDLLHTLAYKGMNVFPQYTANLPTQLWIAGRYVQSISLLIAPLFITRKFRYHIVFTVYSLISGLLLFTIFSGYFPVCFIEGSGLTPFKKTSEFIISAIVIGAIGHLLYRRDYFAANVLRLLVWSMAITVGSEIMFTFYISVYGISNLVGHYFKIIAYYLIYKALVVNGLVMPYDLLFRDLKRSEEKLKQYRDHLEEKVQERTTELNEINEELAREINERIKTEQALRESKQFANQIIDLSPNILHLFDLVEQRTVYINSQVQEILGYRREDVLQQGPDFFKKTLHPDDMHIFENLRERFAGVADNEIIETEFRMRKANGEWCWLYRRDAVFTRDASGVPKIIIGNAQDITERKKAEQRITAHHELLRLFTKTVSRKEYLDAVVQLIRNWSGCRCVGIRIVSDNGTIPYESYVGYSREFWESENHLSLKHDHCICTRVMSGRCEPHDQRTMTPFGSFQHDNITAFVGGLAEQERTRYRGVCLMHGFSSLAIIPIYYGESIIATIHMADEREGRVSREFVEFFEDVTPLIGEAIHKLDAAAERKRLVAAIESAAEAIVITDTKGMIEYVNPAFGRITGFTREEVLGRDLHFIDSGKHGEEFYSEMRATLGSGKTWSGQLVNKKKDGSLYHEECTVSPIKGPSGETVNYVYVKRDVTERLRLESIAEAVTTMNNIGYIFAGIRHEMGNPINSVKMALSVLKSNLGSYARSTISEYIDRSLGELSRVEYLLKSLKSFNLFESPELQLVQLRRFMEQILSLVRDDFSKRGITVSLLIDPEVKTCYADPRALQQVLINVLTNACDACEGRECPAIDITISKTSGIILIRVADTGWGMTERQQEELFKPFRTTKTHGTGLGLVLAKRMLATMSGTIRVTSRHGEGTVVEISLPEQMSGSEQS
ncbi:MAG: MASE3 domain-containing protein [Nitrospirota bacterium]